ncbi:hypothetical protein [Thalassolituus maritimus]|uniref:Uncharacterized protein n=1 Tax=Thalassolituus maritimus TaxID=484498 RepID=A0ABQ0A3D9_9GAMM
MNYQYSRVVAFVVAAVASSCVSADLVALNDKQMSAATGEGLGFALENFVLDTENAVTTVTGINSPYDFDSDGESDPITINWTELYIGGEVTDVDRANGITSRGANIGSYLNPWVIRSQRGGLATSGDPYTDSSVNTIRNDIAFLEIATDSYDSELQNSVTYAQYQYYDSVGVGTASQNIQAEIDELVASKDAVVGRYDDYQSLVSSINDYYTNVIFDLEVTADQAEDAYKPLQSAALSAYADLSNQAAVVESFDGDFSSEDGCVVGEECSVSDSGCGGTAWFPADNACNAAREVYNDLVDPYVDAREEAKEARDVLIEAKAILRERLNEVSSDDQADNYLYSYLERLADRDSFVVACGADGSFDAQGCGSGKLARKSGEQQVFDSILVAISNDETRRRGMDIRSAFEFNVLEEDGTSRDDSLSVKLNGLFIDGTSFRFWSRDDENGLSELNGELRLNMFARSIDINACGDYCVVDGNDEQTQVNIDNTTLHLNNFLISLNLGYGEIQPMKFGATSDGNFQFTLTEPNPAAEDVDTSDPQAMQEFYNRYYANAPKSFVFIEDVVMGSNPNNSIGSVTVDGFRAQYLRVQSRDL